MNKSLQASSFILCEPSQSMPARELWAVMADDLCEEFSEQYEFEASWYFRVCLKAEAAYSPDKQYVRYRTMEASIRRKASKPTLLDLSVGNLYSKASAVPAKPEHIINDPNYSKWARNTGQIPLVEHVRLIRQFAADLMDAGWQLEESALRPIKIPPPLIKNGQGIRCMPTEKFSSLAKSPAEMMSASLDFAVVWPEISKATWGATQLSSALNQLLRVDAKLIPRVRKLRKISPEVVNLVLLGVSDDLDNMPELREELREAEAAGVRFKLAKLSTLGQPYPASNIAFDMFVIAGGRPWVPVEPQPAFCSMDAGHDRIGQRSRWVKVETDVQQAIKSVGVFDTSLAEHLPVALHDTMWPSEPDAIICRDGRLSQERAKFEERAAVDRRPLIEAKKSPKAILWHSSESGVYAAEFGDAVIDVHDEVLLQTVPQNVNDYIHPVRLALQGGDAIDLSTIFLHQHAIPGLSLFRMSRLPGALYFADLVSKLTAEGWPKVVGRGFNIPRVVP